VQAASVVAGESAQQQARELVPDRLTKAHDSGGTIVDLVVVETSAVLENEGETPLLRRGGIHVPSIGVPRWAGDP
jgi:hypothetical protein